VPSGGALAGAILARRLTDHSFSPAEEDALARLARMAGVALAEVARAGRSVAPGADPVTGFAPRDQLPDDLRSALRAAKQHRMPVALMLIEVVGLGSRRSGRGRRAGDQALASVASVLAGRLRVGDVAYRFGPDEIAVLLPMTGPESAAAVTERMVALPLVPEPGGTGQPEHPTDSPAGPPTDHCIQPDGGLSLRAAWAPVEGRAEDVVLAVVRALAATRRPPPRPTRRPTRPDRPGRTSTDSGTPQLQDLQGQLQGQPQVGVAGEGSE
jgi:diguanylate cyclase (GGDEF)-like protein